MTGRLVAIIAAVPEMTVARRVITRPSDAGNEVFDAVDCIKFAEMQASGAFALSWRAHGLAYGIPVSVATSLAEGRDVLANVSRSVLIEADARFAGLQVISLTATHEVLSKRLMSRGRENNAQIARQFRLAVGG